MVIGRNGFPTLGVGTKFELASDNQRPSSKDEGLGVGLKAGAADAVCSWFSSPHTLKPSGVSL